MVNQGTLEDEQRSASGDIRQRDKGCETDEKMRHGAGEVTQRLEKALLGDRGNIIYLIEI